MPDKLAELAQNPIYGELIVLGLGVIISVIGSVYGLYKWIFHRQIARIDKHEESITDIDQSQAILSMQISLVQKNAEEQNTRHKEELDSHRRETDRRVESLERAFEKQLSLLQGYLEQLVQQGERRRNTDDN